MKGYVFDPHDTPIEEWDKDMLVREMHRREEGAQAMLDDYNKQRARIRELEGVVRGLLDCMWVGDPNEEYNWTMCAFCLSTDEKHESGCIGVKARALVPENVNKHNVETGGEAGAVGALNVCDVTDSDEARKGELTAPPVEHPTAEERIAALRAIYFDLPHAAREILDEVRFCPAPPVEGEET